MDENTVERRKPKTRSGSGYLKQLYSTAKTTATGTHSHLKNLTTLLVNFVPVDKVDASELQVRTHFDDAEIESLANSIKVHGVLQPILVVQNGDRYKVIAGERRLRASKHAGMERIPARIITTDDKGTHEIALRENLDRVDLHPIEEGEAYVSLLETQAYTSHEGIAKGFLKPKSRITECIGFTRLPDETKRQVMDLNLKNRALLRNLLNTPPETHESILKEASGKEEEILLSQGKPNATGQKQDLAKSKRESKLFEFKLDQKSLSVPPFRWKVGEGPERLSAYVETLKKLIQRTEKEILK